MADDDATPELALPGAAAAFARLAAAVGEADQDAPLLTRVPPQDRARALARSLLDGIAQGRPWDDAWFSGPGPVVADDHLVAAVLEAAAALMHLGADCAGLEPADFLRRALHGPAQPG